MSIQSFFVNQITAMIGYHPTYQQFLDYLIAHPNATNHWMEQIVIDYCKKEIAAGLGGSLI